MKVLVFRIMFFLIARSNPITNQNTLTAFNYKTFGMSGLGYLQPDWPSTGWRASHYFDNRQLDSFQF